MKEAERPLSLLTLNTETEYNGAINQEGTNGSDHILKGSWDEK